MPQRPRTAAAVLSLAPALSTLRRSFASPHVVSSLHAVAADDGADASGHR
jgi:hypothetical protein